MGNSQFFVLESAVEAIYFYPVVFSVSVILFRFSKFIPPSCLRIFSVLADLLRWTPQCVHLSQDMSPLRETGLNNIEVHIRQEILILLEHCEKQRGVSTSWSGVVEVIITRTKIQKNSGVSYLQNMIKLHSISECNIDNFLEVF